MLYEKICADSCLAVQQWWRASWPERARAKHEAATFLQTMYRGQRGRKNYKSEAKAKKALRHLFYRKASAAWSTWCVFATRSAGVKRLLHKIKWGAVLVVMEIWQEQTAAVVEDRRQRIAPVYNRFIHRLLVLTFDPWKSVWQQAVKVKTLMRKSLLGNLAYCFEQWREKVCAIVSARTAIADRRNAGAVVVQKTVRGYQERNGSGSAVLAQLAQRKTTR